MRQLSINRGDTFYAVCQLVDEFGTGKSITGMQVFARLVDLGGNVAKQITTQFVNDNEGIFALAQFDTSATPPALYTLEITYSVEGSTVSSTSLELMILKRVVSEPVRFAQVGSAIGNTRVLMTVPATAADVSLWDIDWDTAWA